MENLVVQHFKPTRYSAQSLGWSEKLRSQCLGWNDSHDTFTSTVRTRQFIAFGCNCWLWLNCQHGHDKSLSASCQPSVIKLCILDGPVSWDWDIRTDKANHGCCQDHIEEKNGQSTALHSHNHSCSPWLGAWCRAELMKGNRPVWALSFSPCRKFTPECYKRDYLFSRGWGYAALEFRAVQNKKTWGGGG